MEGTRAAVLATLAPLVGASRLSVGSDADGKAIDAFISNAA
jgi:hypothetical protein